MPKPGPKPRPHLQVVREGNPRKRPLAEGVVLPPHAPPEPDWRDWFPQLPAPPRPKKDELEEILEVLGEDGDEAERRKRAELMQARAHARRLAEVKIRNDDNQRARDDAHRAWMIVVPQLDAQGLLAEVDLEVLADVCVCSARIRQCERDISRNGVWVPGERGAQKNPSTTAANQYRTQLKFYVSELGMSPSSRTRLEGRGGDGDDPSSPFDV